MPCCSKADSSAQFASIHEKNALVMNAKCAERAQSVANVLDASIAESCIPSMKLLMMKSIIVIASGALIATKLLKIANAKDAIAAMT